MQPFVFLIVMTDRLSQPVRAHQGTSKYFDRYPLALLPRDGLKTQNRAQH